MRVLLSAMTPFWAHFPASSKRARTCLLVPSSGDRVTARVSDLRVGVGWFKKPVDAHRDSIDEKDRRKSSTLRPRPVNNKVEDSDKIVIILNFPIFTTSGAGIWSNMREH